MNKYPAWKYAIIAIALVASLLYATPNFFGEVPAVQVSGLRTTLKVDDAMRASIEQALKAANVQPLAVDLEAGVLRVRFANGDQQRAARDAIAAKVGAGYSVAMTLLPNSPHWLQLLGAKPMSLGLDLRGGVHYLLQVDMKSAANKAVDRNLSDVRALLRDKKVYYSGIGRDGDRIVVRFRDPEQRVAAAKLVGGQITDLLVREQDSGAGQESALTLSIKPEIKKRDEEAALQQNIQTLRNRVNELGVSEPIVQQQGPDRIVVELAGCLDPVRCKEIIGRTATLEIRLVAEEYGSGGDPMFGIYRDQPAPVGADKFPDSRTGEPVLVKKQVILTGDRITNAQANFDEHGRPAVNVTLDNAGGRIFRQVTRENIKKRMAILLVEKTGTTVPIWPTIQDELGSNFRITGISDTQESRDLALLLRAGALAAGMDVIEERTVGPSLGQENIAKGFNAVLYGFIAIAAFMIFYYMAFGLISVVALACNLLFLVALLSIMQATLTLPGIAAIALTLGMAIDANVLINERIREEVRSGMTPQMAIQAGYERAFGTILDSNVTTLIAGLALLAFGSGPIRGFAVVHCLGILTSIFSAVVVSRGLVNLVYGSRKKVTKLHIGDTEWHKKKASS
jgi:preprotein translocase subunit SecD